MKQEVAMFFRQRVNDDASLSYLFGCGGQGKAAAVDVLAGDEIWYLEQAERLHVDITYVIDTHVHADHHSGGRRLAELAGGVYALHERNFGRTGFVFLPLKDEEQLTVGNTVLRVLHTPGHTDDSICLLVTDRRRGEAPWFVLTGDTLFVGAVGRPDLAGREREMAMQLWQSLHDKLLDLPDEVEVYPGHQAGSPCGVGLSGKPSSTIGFEKRCNPVLTLAHEAFVDAVLRELPPPPADMAATLAANLGHMRVA